MACNMIDKGEKDPEIIKHKMETFIGTFPETNIEYINFCDPKTLEDINIIKEKTINIEKPKCTNQPVFGRIVM